MKTSWRVFVRDAKRILAVPKAFIIVIGILITPALYAWLNIAAFWDPYNNTEAIPIAVVNEDKGATSDLTGEIKVGDQIVDQLRQNDQLGWEFLSADELLAELFGDDKGGVHLAPMDLFISLVG